MSHGKILKELGIKSDDLMHSKALLENLTTNWS